ncbi:hypothetical protein R1flu_001213 [Riccia fluitans]|uniref:DAGKc domain-containing protein n=1 Tax=Riccia fluitans TaxID=41844 RepID=A0ABD1Y2N5_9MARC
MEVTAPSSSPDTLGKRDYVFIVNPNGANGRTGELWRKLRPQLTARLGKDWNVSEKFTSGPQNATQLTREAIHDGAAAVVAVGGDGTLHEVVNGFFDNGELIKSEDSESIGPKTALGLLPMGTGSDFARVFDLNKDINKAIDRLCRGEKKKIDVGRVIYGKERKEKFFINVADLHLSAKAGFFAGMHKQIGNLCYVIGALRGFQGHRNRDFKIRVDGGEWETWSNVTAICVGNSKYFGGGMKITPSADPSSGDLEAVIIRDHRWYNFLVKLHTLYLGSHVRQKNVFSMKVRSIDVAELDNFSNDKYPGTFIQADGEHLGFLDASITSKEFHDLSNIIMAYEECARSSCLTVSGYRHSFCHATALQAPVLDPGASLP